MSGVYAFLAAHSWAVYRVIGRSVVGSQALGLADLLALVAEAHHDIGMLACLRGEPCRR